jgi:hypothetical protein
MPLANGRSHQADGRRSGSQGVNPCDLHLDPIDGHLEVTIGTDVVDPPAPAELITSLAVVRFVRVVAEAHAFGAKALNDRCTMKPM